MENHLKPFVGRFNLYFFMVTLLLVQIGHTKAENKSEPLKNANLAPYWQWISAYECLLLQHNWTDNTCSMKDILTMAGTVNVSDNELTNYCQPNGCRKYIWQTLDCIRAVERDFWFANNASVKILNETVNQGCDMATAIITGNYTRSSETRMYQKAFVSLALPGMVFMALVNM